MHGSSPGCWESSSCRMLWCHSLFVAVLLAWMDMDNTWIFPGCFTIGTTQDSWQRSLFLLQAIDYSNVPNSQKELHQSSSSSAVQSLFFLQKLSLSLMFFLERSGFFAALLETIQKSCPHCQDTILQRLLQSRALWDVLNPSLQLNLSLKFLIQ